MIWYDMIVSTNQSLSNLFFNFIESMKEYKADSGTNILFPVEWYDVNYRHWDNPIIDTAMDNFNTILIKAWIDGWFACFDESWLQIQWYTNDVKLSLPIWLDINILSEIVNWAQNVINTMQPKKAV